MLNKYYGTSILISQSTAEALGDGFVLRDVDRVKVKGKAQASGIFELLGEGDPAPELAGFVEVYHQGLELYRQKRWAESAAAFDQALKLHPQDATSQRYLSLAQKYQESPPEADWEAVTVMDGK